MEFGAKFSSAVAPPAKPLPLWILYPVFFMAVYLSHWSLLRLPYFWDEAGYYIPAALDYFRTGSLIPQSTLTNAHPPLPSVLLAGWWHVAGFVISGTRTFLCMVAAAALLGVFRFARGLAGSSVAAMVTGLTMLYPVWFAQSTLAHADLFAAAFTIWGLSFYFERYSAKREYVRAGSGDLVWTAILFSLAALSKETAILTPIALGLWETSRLLTEGKGKNAPASLAWLAVLFVPMIPLALWYIYHYQQTGFMFGNPEFLRYNATANISPLRFLISLWHRLVHLAVHMNMFVPVVCTLVILRSPKISGRSIAANSRPALLALGVCIAGNAVAFSLLGGALLTRYLLPVFPLVLLLCVATWHERMRRWWIPGVISAAAFAVGLWINPPYGFAPEDNLTYRDEIVLHQQAIRVITNRYPSAIVLTAWPASSELRYPYLGYTPFAVKVVALENFSLNQLQQAETHPSAYDTAFVFSTKWVPAPGLTNFGSLSEQTDIRFFDFHRDLSPRDAAEMLHGEIVWQGYRHGGWAAVLRFRHAGEAK